MKMERVITEEKLRKWRQFHDRECGIEIVPRALDESEEAFYERILTIAKNMGYTAEIRKEGDGYFLYRL
jgi:hypothetical protein